MKTSAKRLLLSLVVAFMVTAVLGLTSCGNATHEPSQDKQGGTQQEQASDQQNETRSFTDSLGRTVDIPTNLTAIAPSGHTANLVLATIAPEKMVAVSQKPSEDQAKYLPENLKDLPEIGAAFGNKGNMNKEAVVASGAQIIIDAGEPKDGMAEDLDALQEQMGIPVIHITTNLYDWPEAYRTLGDILDKQERGEDLATYCENAWNEASRVNERIDTDDRVDVAYLTGDAGLNAFPNKSFQSTIVDMFTNNVVQLENASGSGMGAEISLEQLAAWDPELILFQEGSIYDTVGNDAAWAGMSAIANNNYYEVPATPYGWLNNPPTVNQILGLQWLPRLLYPEKYSDAASIQEVVKSYYALFYGYDLSDAELAEFTQNATA